MKAILLARVSTEDQTTDQQLPRLKQYAERQKIIKTTLLNITWDGKNLSYDYQKPFNIFANYNSDPQ